MREATKGILGAYFAAIGACIVVFLPPQYAHGNPTKLRKTFRALEAGATAKALRASKRIKPTSTKNYDYVLYARGQAAFLEGRYSGSLSDFRELAKVKSSRFQKWAKWKIADTLWEQRNYREAIAAYKAALSSGERVGDAGLARFRIAVANKKINSANAEELFKTFLRKHPNHEKSKDAFRLLNVFDTDAPNRLSNEDRIKRAETLIATKNWRDAVRELSYVSADGTREISAKRDFALATSYYKMRRHYDYASQLFLQSYPHLNEKSAEALFFSARALSRADHDKEAISLYLRVVKEFPKTAWAAEASLLAGWLKFNLRDYKGAVPLLAQSRAQYPRSKWAVDALWYEGMSQYMLKNFQKAEPLFALLAQKNGRLIGGKGLYWEAMSQWRQGKKATAHENWKRLSMLHPFSWYSLLGNARLEKDGKTPPVLAEGNPPKPANDKSALRRAQKDPLIRKVDELIRAGLRTHASTELRRSERRLTAKHGRNRALSILFDRYAKANNFHRPWMLSVIHGARALNSKPRGGAAFWWKHAYPLAYGKLVEKWRDLGGNPPYYLYSIMRKESGFNPNTHSYADAQGLLQMIPATTKRVAQELTVPYTEDLLFDPAKNIQLGSWYIGRLHSKFKQQIPFAAASYNAGPRAMMDWMNKSKKVEADVFVELISYNQARNYARRVTETYARYVRLYGKDRYKQPLKVDLSYLDNKINY